MSNRLWIIVLSGMLLIFGAVAPVAVMSYLSWNEALHNEQQRLKRVAGIMMARTNEAVDESMAVLRAMNQSQATPCSTEHIALMRSLTLSNNAVQQIGYFSSDVLQCSSWGTLSTLVHRVPVDFTTKAGVGVTRHMTPVSAKDTTMMALQMGKYDALLNTARFVYLVDADNVQLVLANRGGEVISTRGTPDEALVARLIADPQNGVDQSFLYVTVKNEDFITMAIVPRSELQALWRHELLFYLPIAILFDILLIVLIVRVSRRMLSPLAELEVAIKKREFFMHYQPVIDVRTGVCIGAEALVRWKRPDGTMVRPDVFIAMAEEHGLITQITDQVIGAVVRDLRPLLLADRSLHISVNLSAADINDGHIVPVISKHLANTGIHPEQIWFEMTERGFMDIKSARATLKQIRQLGHSTALDDFGTGYSSLQYLQRLPMDALKIDKSFVDTIGTLSATSSVISHIIDMAKTLNMLIVAEGVETQEQEDYLRAHGVRYMQGWFYTKALPLDEFITFYHETKARFGAAPIVLKADRAIHEDEEAPVNG